MAKASEDIMSDEAQYSSTLFFRNTDAMTIALREKGTLDITELIQLNRNAYPPPTRSASTTLTTGTTIFSSREESTKPTSASSSNYPIHGYIREDQAAAAYEPSLCATQGSGSDTEREAIQYNELSGLGGWIMDGPNAPRTLKGSAKGRRPPPRIRQHKSKKYDIVLHCYGREKRDDNANLSSDEEGSGMVAKPVTPRRNSKEAKLSRQRRNKFRQSQLSSSEVDDVSTESPAEPLHLRRARLYVLIGLVVTLVLTFALCTYAAYHTGKNRTACFQGILFSATVLVSWCFAIIAMIRARRVLLEALLAGLLQFLVGVALVVAIHDLM